MELIVLLIRLCGNDVKAHVLHVSLQRGLVLDICPGDLQIVLVTAVHNADLRTTQGQVNAMQLVGS